MKKLLILSPLLIFLIFFLRCRKDRSTSQLSSDAYIIQQAQQYFTDSISGQNIPLNNLRITTSKTPLWGAAYTVSTAAGKAVVVPIKYSKSLHVRSNFSGLK